MIKEKYLDTAQMAQITGYAQRTMHLYLSTGKIPGGFTMGNSSNAKWVISEKDFQKWIKSMREKKKAQ